MDITVTVDAYAAGAAELRKLVAGISPTKAVERPVPGKWSSLELVCHLADWDLIYIDRMKRVISFDNPLLLAADEMGFLVRLAYDKRDLDEEVASIDANRKSMTRILRTLVPADYSRIGQHSEAGPRTLEQLLQGAVNHVVHHGEFLREKRRALGLPE